MTKDKKALQLGFMQEAIAEAATNLSSAEGGPFGAVVVKDNKIIGRGHNQVLKCQDPTCHGEIQAIRAACAQLGTHDLSGCELYTSAYPCPMCLSAIVWANIKKVYYANTVEDAAEIGFRDEAIYSFLAQGKQDTSLLELEPCGREAALPVFQSYKQKGGKLY